MPELKARHAFGSSENIETAIQNNTIDAYDILFLDGDTPNPKIGWIDKDGKPVIVQASEGNIIEVDALPESGEKGVIYVYQNEGYIWNGTEFVSLSKPADLSALEKEIATKVDEETLDAKLNEAELDDVVYEISSKPTGTIVDYRKKEIRVMCPSDTQWTLQSSGEGSDPNKYYIGFKAYAPEGAVSFKEDIAETISDQTMYYFEDNEFAGIDEFGRKYSVVWFPVATYDPETQTWTYSGAQSNADKYKGWYYSVEWYNDAGKIINSDCIRINLSNEDCHTHLAPFYVSDAIQSANTYTDEQLAKFTGAIEVVEF